MAGLIPQSFIDDLLNRVDIVEVVDKRVALKKSGRNYTACCPFHNEKTPSFSVQPERQFYYCFGCGAGGNAIGFVMNFDGVEFPEAVEILAKDNGMEVPREESKTASRKQSENAKLLDVLERASKFYQHQLRNHDQRQEAVNYLKSRGVSGVIARDFGLGFAPPGWDNLLTALGSDAASELQLERAGLIVRKDRQKEEDDGRRHYDRFRHRIMFPIRDTRGRTIAFGGRVLGDDKPKYLNSPETAVFHKGSELYGLFEAKRVNNKMQNVLIVEGYMDVIALAQMGIHNAVATLGTATSERHLVRLFRLVPEVVFCFDGDEAGRTAAWRALETTLPLLEDGRQVKFLFLPEGTDPDSFVRDQGKEAFDQAVSNAAPLEDFLFDKLSADINLDSIEGRAKLSNLAKPLIRKMPKGIYAQLMLDRLSATLGVNPETLTELMASAPPPPPQAPPPQPPPTPTWQADNREPERTVTGSYRKPAALKAIELLLSNPELALSIKVDLSVLRSAEDESRKMLVNLVDQVRNKPDIEASELVGYVYGSSLGSQLTQLLNSERITPIEGSEQEFNEIIDNILSDISRKLNLLQLKESLKSRIGAAEPPKDKN